MSNEAQHTFMVCEHRNAIATKHNNKRCRFGRSLMLVDVLKLIHLLLTLSLLGSTFLGLFLVSFHKHRFIFSEQNKNLNRFILWLLVFAILTGTLLIYPKHFTFHTPWIQAAYLLVFLCGTLISMLMVIIKKRKWPWLWSMSYLFLLAMFIGIIHDAVTKTTFLF